MLTVKEALELCDIEKLIKEYQDTLPDDFDKENEGLAMAAWYFNVLKLIPAPSERKQILTAYPVISDIDEGYEYMDACMVYEDELTGKISYRERTYEEIYKMTKDELWNELRNVKTPQTYAFEFSDWEEILGFYVPDCEIEMYGLERVMASVVHEMTFFGYEREPMEEEREELGRRVDELKEILELPEEEQKKQLIPASEVFKDWVDERTPEEKANDELNMARESYISRVRFIVLINNIFDEIKRG